MPREFSARSRQRAKAQVMTESVEQAIVEPKPAKVEGTLRNTTAPESAKRVQLRGSVSASSAVGAVATEEAEKINRAAKRVVITPSEILGEFLRNHDEQLASMLRLALKGT